jgi:hypothetical protein
MQQGIRIHMLAICVLASLTLGCTPAATNPPQPVVLPAAAPAKDPAPNESAPPPESNIPAPTEPPNEKAAIVAIKERGGSVTLDENDPNTPVVGVNLTLAKKVTDADLILVRGLKKLETLSLLYGQITDASLEQLKGLENLRTLDLSLTKVTGRLEQSQGSQ